MVAYRMKFCSTVVSGKSIVGGTAEQGGLAPENDYHLNPGRMNGFCQKYA
jgi:hypothetical protein